MVNAVQLTKWLLIQFQVHQWFHGVDWDNIYNMEAAFIPEVNDELDTQNFEKFEEVLFLSFSKIFFCKLIIFSLLFIYFYAIPDLDVC